MTEDNKWGDDMPPDVRAAADQIATWSREIYDAFIAELVSDYQREGVYPSVATVTNTLVWLARQNFKGLMWVCFATAIAALEKARSIEPDVSDDLSALDFETPGVDP